MPVGLIAVVVKDPVVRPDPVVVADVYDSLDVVDIEENTDEDDSEPDDVDDADVSDEGDALVVSEMVVAVAVSVLQKINNGTSVHELLTKKTRGG